MLKLIASNTISMRTLHRWSKSVYTLYTIAVTLASVRFNRIHFLKILCIRIQFWLKVYNFLVYWRVPEQYCNQIVALQDEQRVESDDMLALILRKHGYTVAVNALDSKLNGVDVLCAKVHDDLKTHGFKIKVLKDYLTRQGVTVNNRKSRLYHGLKHEATTY